MELLQQMFDSDAEVDHDFDPMLEEKGGWISGMHQGMASTCQML
jgi:hypothetical protein